MTLVQLFAWMTEMTIYRLNRVPDKTYVHFLNFIGEERRDARPAVAPLTFGLANEEAHDVMEVPPYTRCATRQQGGEDAIQFLTTDPITVHGARLQRVVAVHAGTEPAIREVPFDKVEELEQVAVFGGGRGVQPFRIDKIEHGPEAYTPFQYLYVAHDDFRYMDFELDELNSPGRIRLRTTTEENLPLAGLFRWERYTESGWIPLQTVEEEEEVLGVPEVSLVGHMLRPKAVDHFGHEDDPFPIPEALASETRWIRGVIDYERWLSDRMLSDLEITWRDDRGGEERLITNWDVKYTGRHLEFFIQDMPPIRPGWTVRLTMVDRSMPTGRNAYFPRYRFSYRKGDSWEVIAPERVRYQNTAIILTGPFTDMVTDGFNLRAERLETVGLRTLAPGLEVEATWIRPVVLHLAAGTESNAAEAVEASSLPRTPYQPASTLPPLVGMKFFIGADVFENRAQRPVMLELEVSFEIEAEAIVEPKEQYALQLTYRAPDTWRVVHTEDGKFARFTFADLDPEGALEPGRRKIRIFLDPKEQLKGMFRSTVGVTETCWLRLELMKAQLSRQADAKTAPAPINLRVHAVRLGVDGVIGKNVYEQPMPGLKTASVEHRPHNRRLSRALVRSSGRLSEHHPFDTFIDIADTVGPTDTDATEHTALYLQLSKPLPMGARHAFTFKCRGETWLPTEVTVVWEQLEALGPGRHSWRRLTRQDEEERTYRLDRSGVLSFEYPDPVPSPREHGTWLRALFRWPKGSELPALPPVSHIMLNTVDGVNLHEFRMEKFSGLGVPHQAIKLRRSPLFLHSEEESNTALANPDQFPDIRVFVTEEDGERREWRRAPGNSLLTASKDDRVFIVDAVEGQLTFGNGIRGKICPVGTYNVLIEVYHVVPGDAGNVAARKVVVPEGLRRRRRRRQLPPGHWRPERGVHRRDHPPRPVDPHEPRPRGDPDGLRDHRQGGLERGRPGRLRRPHDQRRGDRDRRPAQAARHRAHPRPVPRDRPQGARATATSQRRCLVNVQPVVRLATFQPVDVTMVIRLRPNANFVHVRELAKGWIRRFLDPYVGGLDGTGWPFGGTLYAQDFGRMVTDLPEVRHVVDVQVHAVTPAVPTITTTSSAHVIPWDPRDTTPGWEKGEGSKTLVLDRDLFVLRYVRVISEEGES
jgi:hypothetical protein